MTDMFPYLHEKHNNTEESAQKFNSREGEKYDRFQKGSGAPSGFAKKCRRSTRSSPCTARSCSRRFKPQPHSRLTRWRDAGNAEFGATSKSRQTGQTLVDVAPAFFTFCFMTPASYFFTDPETQERPNLIRDINCQRPTFFFHTYFQ